MPNETLPPIFQPDPMKLNMALEDAYIAARYECSFKISEELLVKILEKVTNLQQAAIELVVKQMEL